MCGVWVVESMAESVVDSVVDSGLKVRGAGAIARELSVQHFVRIAKCK